MSGYAGLGVVEAEKCGESPIWGRDRREICGLASLRAQTSTTFAPMTYAREHELVCDLLGALEGESSPWKANCVGTEFDYQGGRTDVVLLLGVEVLAFEAKLYRWRVALHQAYRNTSFAHYSYVVLPQATAERAFLHRTEFERRRVGLCFVQRFQMTVLIPAPALQPILPALTERARAAFGSHGPSHC